MTGRNRTPPRFSARHLGQDASWGVAHPAATVLRGSLPDPEPATSAGPRPTDSGSSASDTGPRRGRRGRLVVLVGPDGVGKTTVAAELLRRRPGRYLHFRPPLLSRRLPAQPPASDPAPKREPFGGPFTGWLRLWLSVSRFWAGYLSSVRPLLREEMDVVADRWGYGYLGQPRPLGFRGPEWMASVAVRSLPRPHLVVNLSAPPEVICRRKPELTPDQVRAELARWEEIPGVVTVDAARAPGEVADEIEGLLER